MGKKLKISKQLNSVIIINNNTHSFSKINDIIIIKSEDEYIRIYNPKKSCLILGTLSKIINELPNYFIKSHRSNIINITKIKEIKTITKKRYTAIMINNMEIPLIKSALIKIKAFFV